MKDHHLSEVESALQKDAGRLWPYFYVKLPLWHHQGKMADI